MDKHEHGPDLAPGRPEGGLMHLGDLGEHPSHRLPEATQARRNEAQGPPETEAAAPGGGAPDTAADCLVTQHVDNRGQDEGGQAPSMAVRLPSAAPTPLRMPPTPAPEKGAMWKHLREIGDMAKRAALVGSIPIRIEPFQTEGATVGARTVAFSVDARTLSLNLEQTGMTASLRPELRLQRPEGGVLALGLVLAMTAGDVAKLPADQDLRPQVITDIGGDRREAWWFLAEPAPPAEVDQVAAAMRRHLSLKGGARGLLPGTVVRVADRPVLVTVLEGSGYSERGDFEISGGRARLSDLRDAFRASAGPLATADEVLIHGVQDWLVPGLLMECAVTVMVAAPSSFKSALAVEFACSVATGRSFRGGPVRPGRVVYAALERKEETAKRVLAWAKKREPVPPDRFRLWREPLTLNDEASIERFIALVREWCADEGVALVVIDTLAKGIRGDDVSDMPAAVRGLRRIVDELGCALLVVHHTPQGEGRQGVGLVRGRGDLAGDADQVLSLHRAPGSDKVTIRSAKDPSAAAPPVPIVMVARAVEMPELGLMMDGTTHSALILDPVADGADPEGRMALPTKLSKGYLACEAIRVRLAGGPATPMDLAAMLRVDLPEFGDATPASLKQTVRRALGELKAAGDAVSDAGGRWRGVRT